MEPKYLADIHVHPMLKPYYQVPEKNIWELVEKSKACLELKGCFKSSTKKLVKYSQSNLNKCIHNGILRTRGLIISLYPPEVNLFDLRDFLESLINKDKQIALGSCMSGFDISIIKKYFDNKERDSSIDYFNKLCSQYDYIQKQKKDTSLEFDFSLVSDFQEYKDIIDQSTHTIAGIVSVEGMHSLVRYNSYSDLTNIPVSSVSNTDSSAYIDFLKQYEENISKIKKWNEGKHCPLFITITHHFWNLLCGHARSYEGAMRTFAVNQNYGINEGITLLGKEALKLLFSRANGRRILPDIKHMSSRSRRDLYRLLGEEYLSKNDNIPVICSHAAVNGLQNLSDGQRTDNINKIEGYYFNTWSINLYDEDIRFIHKSGGLIGIILFPERLAGSVARQRFIDFQDDPDKKRDEAIKLLMAHIFHVVRVCNSKDAWDLITIGSDFDGMISSFSEYQELSDFPNLSIHIFQFLYSLPTDRACGKTDHYSSFTKKEFKRLMFDYTPEEIVNKIMYKNLELFLEKYFHDDYLLNGLKRMPV